MMGTKGQEMPKQATQPNGDKKSTTVVINKVKVTESVIHDMHSMIVPVWLHHVSNEEHKILVYALLDEQSTASFIKEDTLHKLGVGGPTVSLDVHTICGKTLLVPSKFMDLE